MRKYKSGTFMSSGYFILKNTILFSLIFIIILSVTGCSKSGQEFNVPIVDPTTEPATFTSDEAVTPEIANHYADERYELVCLIFRLAGHDENPVINTDFQSNMNSVFNEYKNHPAVAYIKKQNNLGGYQAWEFAIHLKKTETGFVMTDNVDPLIQQIGGMTFWTTKKNEEFLKLLNDFYIDTDFGTFFVESTDYYITQKEHFDKDIYNKFNLKWFEQYGLVPDNMTIVLSPISSPTWYGGSVLNADGSTKTVYVRIPYCDDYSPFAQTLAHEFCHAIGNPIGELWYAENEQFRKWADDSVNIDIQSGYPNGTIMAREYLTRAYAILYLYENYNANLTRLLFNEKSLGFPYIEEVYAMLTDYTIVEFSNHEDIMRAILGMDFTIGEEKTFTQGKFSIKYHFLDFGETELSIEGLTGNTGVGPTVFNSNAGDAMYVNMDGNWYLYIDVGENPSSPPNRLCASYKLD